ncbi:hypothetical protein EZS27_003234 [termite gut metagenome]|uniref:BT-3987-like N-terminal domain-containing protein n=1 Tax=termite gut metagenome TaxID=433724 RepID=A0A5J4SVJ9_9ZZZZ
MKSYNIYLIIGTFVVMALFSCNRVSESESNFNNVVYIENAKNNNTEKLMLKANSTELEKVIKASMALPSQDDIHVTFIADLSLVESYNKANYIEARPLPAENYSLSATEATIPAGTVLSPEIKITFKNLDNLSRNVNYVLPITLEGANGVSILNGAKTIYYVLRKGAAITTVASTEGNYFEFPTMETSDVMDGLTQITFEGLIKPRELAKSVNTFLGVEGYCLIRFGDVGHPANEPQFCDTWTGVLLTVGKWQHVAFCINVATRVQTVYLDGELKFTGTRSSTSYGGVVNLGTKLAGSNKFYVGRSYDDARDFIGEMCEVRIWNTVRTQEEIAANIYNVAPDTEGLICYWKMDEGAGRTIKDYSEHGLDGIAKNALKWVPVELSPTEK